MDGVEGAMCMAADRALRIKDDPATVFYCQGASSLEIFINISREDETERQESNNKQKVKH